MVKKKKTAGKLKVKKKVWVPIIAPKMFAHREIGDIYITQPEQSVGRTVNSNLKDLTGNVRDQNIFLTFRIIKLGQNKLETTLIGCSLASSFIKRIVRKGVNRIDELCRVDAKDGSEIILKIIIITLGKTSRSVRKVIRSELQKLLKEVVKKHAFSDIIQNVINHSIQNELKKKLTKIYPIRDVSFRVAKLIEGKSSSPKKTSKKAPEEVGIEKELEEKQEKKVEEQQSTAE